MIFVESLTASWNLLLASSVYVLFGLTISGVLRMFLHPDAIATHLGGGRFSSVLKASMVGIPVPL